MTNYETILVEKRESVAIITINRPDKLNALGRKVHEEGVAALDELRKDEAVRVVVITGAGEKAAEKPKITVDELMAKTVEALGGEANWRKLNSRVTKVDIDFENQGVKGYGTSYQKMPNWFANVS